MIKGLIYVRKWCCVKNPIIRLVIVLLIGAAAGVIYLRTQKAEEPSSANVIDQGHNTESRSAKNFAWFKHWDQLNLPVVKEFYQRYTSTEIQVLWDVKLFAKFGNYEGKEHAETVYPWDVYITRLLELGHPFLDFSDYESALDTRMGILMPTQTYWRTMDTSVREAYLNAHGLPPNTTWETYEAYLIKQIVVSRINWWRSGGMDPFSMRGNKGR